MSPWGAVCLALLVLLLPWVLMPRRAGEVHGPLRLLWWLNALYCAVWHRLEVKGPDPLPAQGPAILISNHTCCIDHMLLQAATWRKLGFVVAKEYYENRVLRPFCTMIGCIPVRRDGRDLAATRAALRALGDGRVVPIFPEGQILPTSGREIGEGKPGVAFIALHADVPVIPAYLYGTPETNMVARSLLTPSQATVVFGPPVDLSDLIADGRPERAKLPDVTERLMGAIRALRDQAQGVAPPGREAGPNGRAGASGEPGHGQQPESRSGALPGDRAAVRHA